MWKPALVASTVLLAACTPQSHRTDADALAEQTLALAGVADVDLTYDEPEALDAADIRLEVRMEKDASADGVVNVVRFVYTGFSAAHEHEEADLDVLFGGRRLHLRAFESRATTDEVTVAAQRTVDLLRTVEGSSANLETQDPPRGRPVGLAFCFPVPRDASRREIRELERAMASTYGEDILWSGQRSCRAQR